ncbi:MAG: pilus assembly protein TadG-related protein [Acidimicrobiia bacterium]
MRRSSLRTDRRDRGAVIPMVALSLTVLMTMTAFAVDLGRMRVERRDLQADADALALDAVQMITGLPAPDALAAAQAEVVASAGRNGVEASEIESVRVGTWHTNVDPPWFEEYTGTQQFPDAVEVKLADMVRMFFDFSTDERRVSRLGIAVSTARTKGELGSVVAGVEPQDPTAGCAVGVAASVQMTVMNYLYTELLGITAEAAVEGEVSYGVSDNLSCQVTGPNDGLKLDAASYQGLAATAVTFDDLAAQLGAGSPDEMLDLSVTQAEVLTATAQALQIGQDPTALRYQVGNQLLAIAGEIDATTSFVFGDVYTEQTGTVDSPVDGSSSTGGQGSVAEASMNVLDVLFATATAIDANNFVGADGTLAVPLPLGDGGSLVDVPMKAHVIEAAKGDKRWKYANQAGPTNSQVSIALDIPVSVSDLPIDLTYLNLLGLGEPNIANATGSIPLIIEVGQATSTYPSIQCPTNGSPATVDMTVTSGAARVRIGTTTDTNFADGISVTTPGSLVAGTSTVTTLNLLSLLQIEGSVDMEISTTIPSFGQSFTAEGAGALDTSADLTAGGGSATNPFSFVEPGPTEWFRYRGGIGNVAVADSVVGSYDFGTTSDGLIGALNLADSRTTRNAVVQQAVNPLLKQLDPMLQPVFNALGATLGGADARIVDVECQVPALANRGDEG